MRLEGDQLMAAAADVLVDSTVSHVDAFGPCAWEDQSEPHTVLAPSETAAGKVG